MIRQIFDERDLPMEDLEKIGLAKDGKLLLDKDDLKALLAGKRTDMLRLENLVSDGLRIPLLNAKLSLKRGPNDEPQLLVHPIYREVHRPAFLSNDEAGKLEKGEVLNLEKTIFDDKGKQQDILVEFDRQTNEFIITDSARILAPDRVNGEYLSLDQKERYRKGREVELEDGTTFQYSSTEKQGIRSNRLALVASIIVDGGLSFVLYKGLHALFGSRQEKENEAKLHKGYMEDLAKWERQGNGWEEENAEFEMSR